MLSERGVSESRGVEHQLQNCTINVPSNLDIARTLLTAIRGRISRGAVNRNAV
jgi:hypothetical protein